MNQPWMIWVNTLRPRQNGRHLQDDIFKWIFINENVWIGVNTLRPRQNGHHFTDDNFKRIFLNENVRILIEISLKFFPKGWINNIPSLVQIMAWRLPGDKPLSESMMVRLQTHICVARPQWVKISLKLVQGHPINNIPEMVQIMAWCRSGNKPLHGIMMVSLHIYIYVCVCVTRPQWVKSTNTKPQLATTNLEIWFHHSLQWSYHSQGMSV